MKLVLLFFTAIALGACGVKPGNVKPPQNYDGPSYPRQYPSENR